MTLTERPRSFAVWAKHREANQQRLLAGSLAAIFEIRNVAGSVTALFGFPPGGSAPLLLVLETSICGPRFQEILLFWRGNIARSTLLRARPRGQTNGASVQTGSGPFILRLHGRACLNEPYFGCCLKD